MIYLTGDTHSFFQERFNFNNWKKAKELTRDDFVIILGDFGGIWSTNPRDKSELYNLKWLNDRPFTTLFIDGNHENFTRLKQRSFIQKWGGKVSKIRDNIYWLRRGQVFTIEGKKFFTFGGAQSHDKIYRIEGLSWWSDELPTTLEVNTGLDNLEKHDFKVDYILSHSAPVEVVEKIIQLVGGGYHTSNNIQKYFSEINNRTSFKKWYFGHFHINKEITEKHTCLYENIIRLNEDDTDEIEVHSVRNYVS
jgi:DNA repair exonuclease SbcCD nuclease subunit